MLTSPEFKDLLSLLEKYHCRYLVIGGYAVMKYTEPRFTKDLDLLIAIDKKNAQAIYDALKEFGAPLKGLSKDDFSKTGFFYKMGVAPLRVDILMSVPGVDFESAWKQKETDFIDGVKLHFISRADLISSKKASGRPQDLLDAENLEKNTTS
ncbi:MAG: hypothetical protein HQM16_07240 [Deltaproteobacteria bacterium]|nr:hypothetical protein [Deltaproteobacteria bacterium]